MRVWILCAAALCACNEPQPGSEQPDARAHSVAAAPPQPSGALGAKMQAALRAPEIVVDADQIRGNGYRIAERAELRGDSMARVESVYRWARGLRAHWTAIHPGKPFDGKTDVTVPADLPLSEGARLVQTLATAGYPAAMTIHCGDQSLTFDVAVANRSSQADAGQTTQASIDICDATGKLSTSAPSWHDALASAAAAVRGDAESRAIVSFARCTPAFSDAGTSAPGE
jgi:hypothetical protein